MSGIFLQEVVLLQKIYSKASLEELERFLKGICGELDVNLDGLSVVENGWVGVQISGRDEWVTVRLLEKEIGLAPVSVNNVEHFSVFRGRVIFLGRSKMEVFVDVGVFSPRPVYAVIPLQTLQGQLVDGGKLALQRIAELFVLSDNFPLEVRVVGDGADTLRAELTEKQMRVFGRWVDMRFDRLVVLGVSVGAVVEAVRWSGLEREVLGVESLGFLEHVVVCRLGTDAVGIVPRLGRRLSRARFGVFSPRIVMGVMG